MGKGLAMELKILMLLSPDFGSDPLTDPFIGISSYLANFGHKIGWVIWDKKADPMPPSLSHNIRVYSTPGDDRVLTSLGPLTVLRILPSIIKRTRLVLKILREERYNLILVRSFVFDGLLAAYISKRRRIPFAFIVSSPPEQDYEALKIDPRRPPLWDYLLKRLSSFAVYRLLPHADLVLPISEVMMERLARRGIEESKMMPYPNGVDVDLLSDGDGTAVRNQYRLGQSKVVIYIGSLARSRQLHVLLQAFAQVAKKRDAKLLMVGKGSDERDLRQRAAALGVGESIIFTGQVPHATIPGLIAAADIGVSPVPPLSFYKASSPSKPLEYMAMARPVVASEEIPRHKEILENSGGGILAPFSPEAFAAAIVELIDNPEEATRMGQMGRQWVSRNVSYEVLARRIEERYLRLVP